MKIALACSAGGHLTELQQLTPAYEKHEHFFVTFRREDSKELGGRVYFVADPGRSVFRLVKNVFQSFLVFFKEKPDTVITTGAGVAVPLCYFAKLFGRKVICIESFCRIENPSFTGRLLYKISDVFLVQWEELLGKYGNKARFWGRLL